MDKYFEVILLEEALVFLKRLEQKHYEKIIYNIRNRCTTPISSK